MLARLTRRGRAAEEQRVRRFVWAIRESAYGPALDAHPLEDTVAFPRIILAGTVAR